MLSTSTRGRKSPFTVDHGSKRQHLVSFTVGQKDEENATCRYVILLRDLVSASAVYTARRTQDRLGQRSGYALEPGLGSAWTGSPASAASQISPGAGAGAGAEMVPLSLCWHCKKGGMGKTTACLMITYIGTGCKGAAA